MYERKFPSNDDWICGTIIKAKGPLSFVVEFESGQTVCRHVDHLRHRTAIPRQETVTDWTDFPDVTLPSGAESNMESSQP